MTTVVPFVCDFERIVPEIRTKLVVSSSKFVGVKGVEPVVCEAVWDTGSFTTVISPAVAKALSLVPMGRSPVHTANGSYLANVYSVDVMLPNGIQPLSLKLKNEDEGSGLGKTSGKGQKGQQSRKGHKHKLVFDGG